MYETISACNVFVLSFVLSIVYFTEIIAKIHFSQVVIRDISDVQVTKLHYTRS